MEIFPWKRVCAGKNHGESRELRWRVQAVTHVAAACGMHGVDRSEPQQKDQCGVSLEKDHAQKELTRVRCSATDGKRRLWWIIVAE